MRHWIRRIAWAVAAQGASSATNFALFAVMAAVLKPVSFGQFTAVVAVYHLALAVTRASVFEPRVASRSQAQRSAASILGWRSTFKLAVSASVLTVVVGAVVSWSSGFTIALALATPVLLAQDGFRHSGWILERPGLTVSLDLVWAVVFGVGLAVTVGVARVDIAVEAAVFGSWLAGGCVSALVGLVTMWRAGATATLSPGSRPPTEGGGQGRLGGKMPEPVRTMGRSQALQSAAFNLLPLVLAVVVSPASASAVKAVLLPFTPILTIVAGTRLVTLPAMSRAVTVGRSAIDAVAVRMVGAGTIFAIVAGLATVVVIQRLPLGGSDTALAYSRDVAWWGMAITTMSTVDKYLADALALGRRSVPVIPMRLAALAVEWTVLVGIGLFRPDADVAVAWTLGVALGSVIWLAPTVTRSRIPAHI